MKRHKAVKSFAFSLGFLLCLVAVSAIAAEKDVWLEAEAFDSLGGWLIDQQSMDQMGSAYVMAHGMGVPVPDAEAALTIPQSGDWIVWVRTRDWTAPWKRGTPAGRFQVLLNGRALPETLGTNGGQWAWQKAGKTALEKGDVTIALHDLTGFNGRCDAVYLTLDPKARPADGGPELAKFRKAITHTERKDELKAMMEKGVPAPKTYHPGGFGSKYEGYHFKDTGHIGVYPNPSEKLKDPKVQERIKALDIQQME